MLNNLFSFINVFNNRFFKKAPLKKINKYYYNVYLIFLKLISYFSKFFTKKIGFLYVSSLQTSRLYFKNLTNLIKKIFIYVGISEIWLPLYKVIKNINNVYILREKKNLMIYKLICLFYKSKIHYYNELNINLNFSKTIANFYNDISIAGSNKKQLNIIIFYYFNKIALTNNPYFYWTYFNLYIRPINNKSKHTKSALFFLYINSIKKFYGNKKKNISFVKTSLNTFKGVKSIFKHITSKKKIDIVPKKKLLNGIDLQSKSAQSDLFERETIKTYNTYFTKAKQKYKFYINNIVYNTLLNNNINSIIQTKKQHLQITWYNKIHNSIIQITKYNIILFLRSSRHFNKGRYSRNRQLYRTGVYWCIWLNVVIVYALHYYFYRVVFSFGYLWLPLGLMILTMFSSRLYKYRYYNINQIVLEFLEFNGFIYNNTVSLIFIWKNNTKTAVIKVISFILNYIFLFKKKII